MNKKINNYSLIILIAYLIYNIILYGLKISGIIYQIIMIFFIVINAIILIIYRKNIKYKEVICIIYFFTWLFSKNTMQCYFNFSNIIMLCITGFNDSNFMKVLTILLTIFVSLFIIPLTFIFLLNFGTSLSEEKENNLIYEDTHYYCSNNYEIYSYSLGAMDGYHYSVGKNYKILNGGDIINISFKLQNDASQEEYEEILNNRNCRLVDDINGSK